MEDKYVFSLYIRVIKRRDVIRCILLLRLCNKPFLSAS